MNHFESLKMLLRGFFDMEDKIEKAIENLNNAILSEMKKMTAKHMVTIKKKNRLEKAVVKAAEILHVMPHADDDKIDREIEKAWDVLDGIRR